MVHVAEAHPALGGDIVECEMTCERSELETDHYGAARGVLFLLGCHKSGTSLLRALFDSHSCMFVVPVESHFFSLIGWGTSYPLGRVSARRTSIGERRQALVDWVKLCNSVAVSNGPTFGDSDTSGLWNLKVLKEKLDMASENARVNGALVLRALFEDAVEGMRLAVGDKRPVKEIAWIVEKSVEHHEVAAHIAHVLPHARFIHIVRNPYANMAALTRKGKSVPFLGSSAEAVASSLNWAIRNEEALGATRYRIVRYEDLVGNARSLMDGLCKWLDIGFEECLVEPTSAGRRWGGNSTSGKTLSGVSTSRVMAWQENVAGIEVELINAVVGALMTDFGYTQTRSRRSTWWPMRREGVSRYLANRAFLLYARRKAAGLGPVSVEKLDVTGSPLG